MMRQAVLLVLKEDEQVCNCGRGIAKLHPCKIMSAGGIYSDGQAWMCVNGCGAAQMLAADRIAEALVNGRKG